MIYEIRMTIAFLLQSYDKRGEVDTQRVKSTLIDYINAKSVCNAYLEADKLKHNIAMSLLKKMEKCAQLSISLDAVVAKPELTNMKQLYHVDSKDGIALRTIWIELAKYTTIPTDKLNDAEYRACDIAMKTMFYQFFKQFKNFNDVICRACKRPLKDHTPAEINVEFNIKCER